MNWSERVVTKAQETITAIRKMRQDNNITKTIPVIILRLGRDDYETAAVLVEGF